MDDFTTNILNESKNEWSILMINAITPHVVDGFKSIFNESLQLCQKNEEPDKYLMTYQNLLSRIPNWNQTIIETEKNRILVKSKCSYLEDLVTCVHIIQLKLLSCVRVGSENKKINIDIPDLSLFLHKIYIAIARKLYSNIYLFELDIAPLEQQRRNREFEAMVQTCIMNTIRDQLPVEQLLRQYIDETQEVDVIKLEPVPPAPPLATHTPPTAFGTASQLTNTPPMAFGTASQPASHTANTPPTAFGTASQPASQLTNTPPTAFGAAPQPAPQPAREEVPRKITFNETIEENTFEPFDLSEITPENDVKLDIIELEDKTDLGIIDLNECVIDLDKEELF